MNTGRNALPVEEGGMMTTYYLINGSSKYDRLLKKIKAVAKQTKAKILTIEDEIRQEEEAQITVTKIIIG